MSIKSITGSLFGKEATPQQSGYGAWPSYAKAGFQDTFNKGQAVGNSTDPYKFVPYTQQGLQAISNLSNPGTVGGNFDFGKRGSAMYDTAANTFNNALGYYDRAAAPTTASDVRSAISNYYNPFEQDVIGGLTNDYQQSLDRGLNVLSSRLGSAFGGDRAVLGLGSFSNQALDDYTKNVANTRYGGYNTAAGFGSNQLQNDRNALLSAGQGYGSIGGNQLNQANSLINARQTMQNIAGQQQGLQQIQNQNLLTADQLQRAPQMQNQGIPLQQLQTLLSLYGPLGNAGYGGTAATTGLIGSGGSMNGGGYTQQYAANGARFGM